MSPAVFTLFGLPVTAYALGMSLGLTAICLWLWHSAKKAGFSRTMSERFILFAIPLGLLFARLAFVLVRLFYYLDRPLSSAFRLWQGGTTVWGAILGFLIASVLSARIHRLSPAKWLDYLAPFGLVAIAIGRFCEGLSGQGFGQEAVPGLAFFPFAVENEWGEWRYAVFLLSGLLALLFALVVSKSKLKRPGDKTRMALILFCFAQIWLESLREDQFLSWGFVKAAQLFAVLILFYLLLEGLLIRGGSLPWPRHLAITLFAVCVLVIIALEFALDKTTLNINLLYLVMLAACLGLCLLTGAASLKGGHLE